VAGPELAGGPLNPGRPATARRAPLQPTATETMPPRRPPQPPVSRRLRPRRGRLRRGAGLTVLALSLFAGALPARAQDDGALKAAIVFNLLAFVQWPREAELPPGSPLRLCGDRHSPLWPHLAALRERPLRQLRIELRELGEQESPRDCQVLVLDAGSGRARPPPRAQAALLTLSSDERPDAGDVVLDLHRIGGRIVFDIDLAAARRGGLQISSKLLRLARTVRE